MPIAGNIKNKIKDNLDALKSKGVLKEIQEDDYHVSIFNRHVSVYPVAFLTGMSLENAEYLTNRANIRTHYFEIVVVERSENITSPNDIEDLMEELLNQFDNDPTLSGAADGAVEAATSKPVPVVSQQKSCVAFSVQIKAKAVKDLTF